MKRLFIEKELSADAMAMMVHINAILERYDEQGYDLSLRQLYYQLVAGDLIPHERSYKMENGKWIKCPMDAGGSTNAEPNYKWVGDIVSDARLAGLIDWDMISDRGRVMSQANHWGSPAEIVEACAEQFRIDKWADQPRYVEVMVEKQALEGVLIPVCRELDIPFTANKGYSSLSAMYGAGRRFADKLRDDKEVHVIYLGDHDPSGIDMTRDIDERLNLFADVQDVDESRVQIHRIALNMPQVKILRPPENPAKLTDSRAKDYVRKFGDSSWELDAIEPKELAKLVRQEVFGLRDETIWAKSVKREDGMRATLKKFAASTKK